MYLVSELIDKKKRAGEHNEEELSFLVNQFVSGEIPDYQMSAWLMAVYFQGMTAKETSLLTKIMKNSGMTFDFSEFDKLPVDKHSTGGVGDKTSIVIAPLVASCDVPVAMIAGRGLGHTGGTLDKLESIEGFSVLLDPETFKKNIKDHHVALIGQSDEICPADRKIYALRDVTATVDSDPLICASIMSKKLAEGIGALVLDVKFGSGAFMTTQEKAEELAANLIRIGEDNGVKIRALITNMNQPLGRYCGNSLEIFECIEILKGSDEFPDTKELCLQLSAHMIQLYHLDMSLENAKKIASENLANGKALKKFYELCERQGAKANFELPTAKFQRDFTANNCGWIKAIDCKKIGVAAIALKAGKLKASDRIDPASGVECFKKIGDPVKKGEQLFRLYANDEKLFPSALEILKDSFTLSDQQTEHQNLIVAQLELRAGEICHVEPH